MNKSKLKSYAPNARRDFIQMIRQRADLLGLTKSEVTPARNEGEYAIIEGRPYPRAYAGLHKRLAEKIKSEGLEQFIERIAYSWFNRFAALRYMEVNNLLSHGFRVLSNADAGKNEPEILTHAAEIDLPGLNKEKVLELKLAGNKDAELYRLLIVAQCNELNRAMPFLFERINDETEILLPDNLLASDSVIRKMVAAIDETDWAEVEIIGWLYQFYISEKKDEVIGKTVKSEDIPAATQLFTPNWIVKYMTQNSLGRLWLEANPHSQLAANMEFYIKPAEDNSAVVSTSNINPEEITILDPACGSGHILVEAYELLKLIYTERGYSSRDIPLLILEKNLFGLDIDERAAQMASFALLMKARKDDRRIFERLAEASNLNPNSRIPNIEVVPDSSALEYAPEQIAEMFFSEQAQTGAMPIRDTNFLFNELETQPSLTLDSADQSVIRNPKSESGTVSEQMIVDLLELFAQGKTLGSLIRVPPGLAAVLGSLEAAVEAKRTSGSLIEQVAAREIEPFIRAARMLARLYDCVVANPPYMGGKGMNGELKTFAAKNYPDSKSDLFAMFIEREMKHIKSNGYAAFVTPFVWMFLSSYEKFRKNLIEQTPLSSLIQLEYNAFEPAMVPVCTFTVKKNDNNRLKGEFIKLSDFTGHQNQAPKTLEAINNPNCGWRFNAFNADFEKIPGSPIAYWISNKIRNVFEKEESVSDIADARRGMFTGDNDRFLKLWFEICNTKLGLNFDSNIQAKESTFKWFPYNKGGDFRKWFGNNEFVINWENDGYEIRNFTDEKGKVRSGVMSDEYLFKKSITWTSISSSFFGARQSDKGFLFDGKGSSCFASEQFYKVLLGFLTTKQASYFLQFLNPTIMFLSGDIAALPFLKEEVERIKPQVDEIVEEAVAIARVDWDSFETSWDFASSPLLSNGELRTTNEDLRRAKLNGNAEDTQPPPANTMATAGNTSAPAPNTPPARLNTMPPPASAMPPATSAQTPASFTMPPAENTMPPAQPTPPSAKSPVEAAWNDWKQLCDRRIARMQQLETENNRLFIEAYGLQDELSPEVPLEQITLARADAEKDVRRLLSYFIGCLMGRYSLDAPGLIYADAGGAGFDSSRYRMFAADDDGIVPVTDIEWFQQDAARQFESFVKTVWGESNLSANLRWIAEQLGGKASETPTETVRRYFSGSFFKDHLQTYKKRPIYWLFSSGKQKAFECLVYLHRYNENTLPRMRHEYVLPLMSKLTAQIEILASSIESADSTSEKTKLTKQKEILAKKQLELAHFDEKLRHTSDMRISLDLDDGVKVNYSKFGDLLAEVKQVAATKE